MANEEQLELIKQGTNAWNKWREEHANTRPDLIEANLGAANLSEANLTYVRLVHTNLENANLSGGRIYGISAWNLRGAPRDQLDLIITNYHEPIVTIDNLEVAQFIYLLLNNQKNPPSNRHHHLESRPNPWSLYGGTEACT